MRGGPQGRERRRTRVLLVDDSETSRAQMRRILEERCHAEVVGVAHDGEAALGEVLRLRPDLVMLDLEMPRMDGFTFLRFLMAQQPTPVVVVSSHSHRSDVFKALELGALDFVAKPENDARVEEFAHEIRQKCALLRSLHVDKLVAASRALGPAALERSAFIAPSRMVAIGASTGGPQALLRLLGTLPEKLPVAFVVAQHMPETFTGTFADRLRRMSPFTAQEASDGDVVAVGRILVAPGGRDLEVRRDADGTLRATLAAPDPAFGYCPSVDRLFASVARVMGPHACAVVLTGMGRDGQKGIAAVRRARGLTLAESDETAVVYGMPRAAAESGVDEVLPLPALAVRVARFAVEG